MKFDNYMILDFPSKSSNEAFARSAEATKNMYLEKKKATGR